MLGRSSPGKMGQDNPYKRVWEAKSKSSGKNPKGLTLLHKFTSNLPCFFISEIVIFPSVVIADQNGIQKLSIFFSKYNGTCNHKLWITPPGFVLVYFRKKFFCFSSFASKHKIHIKRRHWTCLGPKPKREASCCVDSVTECCSWHYRSRIKSNYTK